MWSVWRASVCRSTRSSTGWAKSHARRNSKVGTRGRNVMRSSAVRFRRRLTSSSAAPSMKSNTARGNSGGVAAARVVLTSCEMLGAVATWQQHPAREVHLMAMAVRPPEITQLTGVELMGHLYRRAGFGATRDQLETALGRGYEATVQELLHPENAPP